jgi:hypothetical protein
MADHDHAGATHAGASPHVQHAGHSTATFRDKFWTSLEVAEEPDQNDERDRHAEQQQQNGTHRSPQAIAMRSRSLPPIVAAALAQNAPTSRATKVQYSECAIA